MKKILSSIIILTLTLIVCFYISASLIKYEDIYKEIGHNLKIDLNELVIVDLEIKKLPYPYISIKKIVKQDSIEIRDIKIHFSLFSILKFNPQISSVEIRQIQAEQGYINFAERQLTLNWLQNINLEIPNFRITDFNLMSKGVLKLNLTQIKTKNLNNITIDGLITDIGNFNLKLDFSSLNPEIKLNIQNSIFDCDLHEVINQNGNVSGSVKIKILELDNFLTSFCTELSSLSPYIKENENSILSFQYVNGNDLNEIKNFTIDSDSIQATATGSISYNPKTRSNLDINFKKVRLVNLVKTNNPTQLQSIKANLLSSILENFINSDIKLIIDQFQFSNEIFNNISLALSLTNGEAALDNIKGSIASGGAFNINGKIMQNKYRGIFEGKIKLDHNNLNLLLTNLNIANLNTNDIHPFTFSGDITYTLIDFYLSNLVLKSGSTTITGEAKSKIIGSTPRVGLKVEVNSIDAKETKYPFLSSITSYFSSLTQDMKSPGYLNKFVLLRTLSFLGDFDLTFNNLIFQNYNLGKVNCIFQISPGLIEVNNLNINDGKNYLLTSWKLISKGLKPNLEVEILDGTVNTDILTPNHLLNFRNILLRDYNLNDVFLKIKSNRLQIKQGDLVITNAKFDIENENNLFKIKDLEAELLDGGILKSSGSMLLEPFTYNFVFALNNLSLLKFSKLMPEGLFNTSGIASVNGLITTNGSSLKEQLYNLYIRGNLIAKGVQVNNISIDSFIDKIRRQSYDEGTFELDAKNALHMGETRLNNLKASLELSKGILALRDGAFTTQFSAGSVAANLNIYNFDVNLISKLMFYVVGKLSKQLAQSNLTTQIGLNFTGSIFDIKKNIDFRDLKKLLNSQTDFNK